MGNVKLKDIAEALGVSAVTVSNALTGKKGVSEEVRDKIVKTAEEMGYDRSRYIKAEKRSRIGVIIADKYMETGVSFYWAMYQMVAYAACGKAAVTIFEVLDDEGEAKKILPQMLRGRTVDGLVVIGKVSEPYVEKLLKKSGVPVVLLDFCVKHIPCDAVMSANYTGMYKVTRYLLEQGHREIAFAGSVAANENIMDRYYGYKKAMMEAGAPVRKEWRLEDRDLVSGIVQIELPKKMPSAFVCNSDLTAGRLYDQLVKNGYSVPEDISVAGYDDYLFGHSFAEKLTTYHVDMKQMAEITVNLLMRKIRGDDTAYGIHIIDGVVVERSSVRALV